MMNYDVFSERIENARQDLRIRYSTEIFCDQQNLIIFCCDYLKYQLV